MYSIDVENNRALIQCNFRDSNSKFVRFSALYDTGAQISVFTAVSIDPDLSEDDFKESRTTNLKGLINDDDLSIVGYSCKIPDFYFGNIHISYVDALITFDERVTDNLVGMDVINRITRLGIANTDKILFFKDYQELSEYVNSHDEGELSSGYVDV